MSLKIDISSKIKAPHEGVETFQSEQQLFSEIKIFSLGIRIEKVLTVDERKT